jgi:hypothetical protein
MTGMKRRLLYICVILFSLGFVPQSLAQTPGTAAFFTTIQDMPLMPGLRELPEQMVSFDKPEGRIIETMAAIESGDAESIRAYYESALPELGWARVEDGVFVRQSEMLRMSVEQYQGQGFLRMVISPRMGGPG